MGQDIKDRSPNLFDPDKRAREILVFSHLLQFNCCVILMRAGKSPQHSLQNGERASAHLAK
jgi:hypothetical protein